MTRRHAIAGILTPAFLIVMALTTVSHAGGKSFGDWNGFAGGNNSGETYRYVEHYAKSRDARDSVPHDFDVSWQRFDFTYSRKRGWQFYVTLHLVPVNDPVRVTLSVDNKSFLFAGTSAFGKMDWEASPEFLDAVRKTNQPILVEEVYGTDFKYSAEISSTGLAAALKWASDLQ